MNAMVELVSTGAELLSGRTVNTHAQRLAQHLAEIGLVLARDTTVPDDRTAIRDAVREALQRVSVVMVSGGLGPTSDDVTREAVAEVLGAQVVMHEPTREAIRQRYARTKRAWNENAERHALVLSSARVLENHVGLAPSELIEWHDRLVFLMPGPPHEFEAALVDHVIPKLRAMAPALPLQKIFQLAVIGESDVVRLLSHADFPHDGVHVAYCARPGVVELRLTALPSALDSFERDVGCARERLSEWIYAESRTALESVVVDALRSAGKTIALAESCTGGLVGHRLTNVPGSSDVLLGGIIAYANESKVRELGVAPDLLAREGAVSREVAAAMAEGARRRFGADMGIGISGIAGPGGGTEQKPVGLVYIGVSDAAATVVQECRLSGQRSTIKQVASQLALENVRRRLSGRREIAWPVDFAVDRT